MKQNLDQSSTHTVGRALKIFVLPFLMAAALAGCKPEANQTKVDSPASTNPAGTYSLMSVDGKNVPCAVNHDGHSLTVKSGTFVIGADGTCVSKMVFTPPSGSEATREVKATFTQEGSKLTMKWEGAGTTVGTIEGATFTMNNEGMVLAYKK